MGNHKGSGSRTGALSALLKAFPRRDERIEKRQNLLRCMSLEVAHSVISRRCGILVEGA
jgi:hypothetical protein